LNLGYEYGVKNVDDGVLFYFIIKQQSQGSK
jgi:hypothetical protein